MGLVPWERQGHRDQSRHRRRKDVTWDPHLKQQPWEAWQYRIHVEKRTKTTRPSWWLRRLEAYEIDDNLEERKGEEKSQANNNTGP